MTEKKSMLKMRREPALWVALVATVLQLVVSVLHLAPLVQGAANAVIVAVGGAVVAFAVRQEGQVAALTGVVKAVIALSVALGADVTSGQQAMIMTIVTTLGALFVRTQVVAAVPAAGAPAPAATAA